MTPDEIRQIVRDELQAFLASDRYTFTKNIQIFDARNVQLGKANGTKIGTEATQKLGFYGALPVVQAAPIAAPSGGGDPGVDTSARNAIISIIAALKNVGITS